MRLIFCGGRDFTDRPAVETAMTLLLDRYGRFVVVHGAARGADTLSAEVGAALGLEVEAHHADWDRHRRRAGPLRNKAMLESGVERVVAFPGGTGTANMVGQARNAGVPV